MKRLFYILFFIPVFVYGQNLSTSGGATQYTATPSEYLGYNNPDLFLPDTFFITQGNTIIIYNDNVAYIPTTKTSRTLFTWTSEIGYATTTGLVIITVDTGSYSAKLVLSNTFGCKIDSTSTIIKVEPKISLGNKVILAIGNSLTAGGWQYQCPVIRDSLNVDTLTSIGTQGADPNKQEGRSGWTAATFMGASSPFYIGGVINIPQYLIDNSLATPDIIRIDLGINDSYALANTATTINTLKTLIVKCLDIPNVNIIVDMPSTASNTIYGWMTNYNNTTNYEPYILNMRQFQQLVFSNFKSQTYNSRVYFNYGGLVINRNTGYPSYAGLHTNALHPQASGYREIINGTLNIINHIYQ